MENLDRGRKYRPNAVTDLARLIRCLLHGKNNNNLIRLKWFVLSDILLANGDEPNLILPNFARPLYVFFFSSAFWHLHK